MGEFGCLALTLVQRMAGKLAATAAFREGDQGRLWAVFPLLNQHAALVRSELNYTDTARLTNSKFYAMCYAERFKRA